MMSQKEYKINSKKCFRKSIMIQFYQKNIKRFIKNILIINIKMSMIKIYDAKMS